MKKLVLGMTFFILMFTVVCGADEIRGKVTAPGGDGKSLLISGVTIQAAEAWIEDAEDYPLSLKSIAKGDFVEVDGKFVGPAKMKARKIDRRKRECDAVKGTITSIDASKKKIVISGITVKLRADAWLEGPNHVKIPLELFAPGYKVKCKGDWTGPAELTAFRMVVD